MLGLGLKHFNALAVAIEPIHVLRQRAIDLAERFAVLRLRPFNGREAFVHRRQMSGNGVEAFVHALEFLVDRGELLVKELIEL